MKETNAWDYANVLSSSRNAKHTVALSVEPPWRAGADAASGAIACRILDPPLLIETRVEEAAVEAT